MLEDNCEEFDDSDVPSPDLLTPNSALYQFVTNPNMKSDGDGVYSINYTDPNYIEGDYITISREERLEPEVEALILRVNFKEKTATLIDANESIDLSDDYFLEAFLDL